MLFEEVVDSLSVESIERSFGDEELLGLLGIAGVAKVPKRRSDEPRRDSGEASRDGSV
jgi:hypothetical protein